MPNPIKGEVPLKLSDGRDFVLVLDMEALVEAESAYGKPLPQMMSDASQGFVGAVRAMLYGALRTKQPRVTLGEASAMFISDPEAVSAALEQAATLAFPQAAEGGESANPRPRGKTSGASGAKSA